MGRKEELAALGSLDWTADTTNGTFQDGPVEFKPFPKPSRRVYDPWYPFPAPFRFGQTKLKSKGEGMNHFGRKVYRLPTKQDRRDAGLNTNVFEYLGEKLGFDPTTMIPFGEGDDARFTAVPLECGTLCEIRDGEAGLTAQRMDAERIKLEVGVGLECLPIDLTNAQAFELRGWFNGQLYVSDTDRRKKCPFCDERMTQTCNSPEEWECEDCGASLLEGRE